MPEAVVSACEQSLVRQGLLETEEPIRVDLRALNESRPLRVICGPEDGTVEVVAQSPSDFTTRACGRVRVEATSPYPDRPDEGILAVAVRVTALALENPDVVGASAWGSDRPVPRDDELTRMVERLLRETRALEPESLCILADRKVWTVRVDVDVIDFGGGCFDVAVVAAMAALQHARRPDVTITGDKVSIHSKLQREPLPLPIAHVPLSSTFAVFRDDATSATTMVLDPSWQEERSRDGEIVVSANVHGEICGVYKAGGCAIEADLLARCAQVAVQEAVQKTKVIENALKESADVFLQRDVEALSIGEGAVDARGEGEGVQETRGSADAADQSQTEMAVEEERERVGVEKAQPASTSKGPTAASKEAPPSEEVDMSLSSSESSSDLDLTDAVVANPRRGARKRGGR